MDYREFSELYHYGIKDMRWGHRRFQNEDGSLTPEGRARYGLSEEKASDIDSVNARRKANMAVSTDLNNASKAANAASQAASRGGNIADRAAARERAKAKAKIDLSNQTDDEIRQKVNRMNLERQYKDLATQDVGAGKQYVGDILRDVGDAVSIAGSIATIAATIYMIKKTTGA